MTHVGTQNAGDAPGQPRTVPGDWHPGTIPANVRLHETAYVETSFSFDLYRSRTPAGATLGEAAAVYRATMFDVGPRGRVSVGRYALLNGVRIVCDAEVEIGDFALVSWNVVIMDTYRLPLDPLRRRALLTRGLRHDDAPTAEARPVRIGAAVWIGFDVCVLPGVTIGDGSVVGARSVVADDVEPFTVVAGNPARAIRRLDPADPELLARVARESVAGGRGPA